MNTPIRWSIALAFLAAGVSVAGCGSQPPSPPLIEPTKKPDVPVGAHGGHLLQQGDVAIELSIVEAPDVPPRFRAYSTRGGQALAPESVTLEVTLTRLGDPADRLTFKADGDWLTSEGDVEEPHSFDVEVIAKIDGEPYRWRYTSPEGRLYLSAQEAAAAGLRSEVAGPQVLHVTKEVGGAVAAASTPTILFNVNRADLEEIQVGQAVEIMTMEGHSLGRSIVAHIKPPFEEGSRATLMTVPLPPAAAALASGTPITGRVVIGDFQVPLAVRTMALQHFRNSKVVMAQFDDTYEARAIEVGRQTPEWTEVKSGIKPGTRHMTQNVFVLGSKLDKNSASIVHGH